MPVRFFVCHAVRGMEHITSQPSLATEESKMAGRPLDFDVLETIPRWLAAFIQEAIRETDTP